MKKKVIVFSLLCLLLCGCTNASKMNYDQILGTFAESTGHINVYRTGYKYSLPRGLQVDKSSLYNETITSGHNTYYLYVDVVSYHNKKNYNYEFNPNSYYSKSFNFNDKSGFVEINLKDNNQYLIEIMYNYAKIEVMVDKKDINTSLLYAISILKNISYNDSVIEKLLGKDIFNYSEEDYNIFNTTSNDSNYLNVDNSYQGVDEQEEVYDSDLIN